MARDPLTDARHLFLAAESGNYGRMDDRIHLIVTDALEDANSAEEAGDVLGNALGVTTVLGTEALRALATALVGTLTAIEADDVVRLDLPRPVDVTRHTPPAQVVGDVLRALSVAGTDGV